MRVLVASPAYLERHGAPREPADIVAHPFVRVAGLFTDARLMLRDGANASHSAPIDVAISASHWRPVYELLLGAAGIGVLQEPVCADALASGALVRLLPGYTVPGFDLHALLPVTRPVPSKTRAVLAILEAHLPRAVEPIGDIGEVPAAVRTRRDAALDEREGASNAGLGRCYCRICLACKYRRTSSIETRPDCAASISLKCCAM